MASGAWGNIDKEDAWIAIKLHDKRNRATKSHSNTKDAEKEESNLSWGDDAALPHDADTLRVKFSLKVMGSLEKPTACNEPESERNLSASTGEQHKTLIRKIKRLTMPGFVLHDRSGYLEKHFNHIKETDENASLLDAWLDFSAMKYQAQPELSGEESQPTLDTKAEWTRLPKPQKGWLVPIMTGYKAIDKCYPAGAVEDARDTNTTTCFVEAVHSIGEWKSVHRMTDVSAMIWRYQYDGDWYLCKQNPVMDLAPEHTIIEDETINFETALANL